MTTTKALKIQRNSTETGVLIGMSIVALLVAILV